MSHINRKNKALTFGLLYGCNPDWMFRTYAAEVAVMMSSMAVARNTGIGYICLEHTDFSDIESRLLLSARELKMALYHGEAQWQVVDSIEPERYYTGQFSVNQRGRHWDRKRKETQVKAAPKTAQQLLDEDFANDSPSRLVHKMGDIQNPPHRQSVACIVVQKGGKIHAHNVHWTGLFQELFN